MTDIGRLRPARLRQALSRWLRRIDRAVGLPPERAEDGASTVEFALMFPLFAMTLASSLEASILLSRQTMLERGLDLAARDVQLRGGAAISDVELVRATCARAAILPACEENLLIEMRVVDPASVQVLQQRPPCRRLNSVIIPRSAFDPTATNELVSLRACYAVRPIMPGSTLGIALVDDLDGAFRMVASTVFVVE
jgi:hypothetical protein